MSDTVRYVNTASSGGNGTTNDESGVNAAYTDLDDWEAAEQTVLSRRLRVGSRRQGSQVEASLHRPFVEGLDVIEDALDLGRIDGHRAARKTPSHESVVGIGALSDGNATPAGGVRARIDHVKASRWAPQLRHGSSPAAGAERIV